MNRSFRTAAYVIGGIVLALLLVVGLFLVLTRTDYGLERVRVFAIGQIEQRVAGELEVERVTSEGLLGSAVLHGFELRDPRGRLFARADSARLEYDWRTLFGGQFVIERLHLHDPEVYLEQFPGDTLWNYEHIFPDTTPEDAPDDLILIENATVRNGLLVVRYPWEPDEPVEPEDTAREILEPLGGGIVRVLRFEAVNGEFPRVLWDSPVEEGQLFEIASLSTRGYIWEDPFDLRDLRGTVTVRDSVIAFDAPSFRLPGTRGSALGRVVTGDEHDLYDFRIDGEDVAFTDLQWLYPPLPDQGGGSLVFRMQSVTPDRTLWLFEDMRVSAPGTDLAGTFGVVTGDTLYFTRVDLRASPLDVALFDEVLPAELELDGLLVGTVEVEGPISALRTRGDLRFTRAGPSADSAAVRWSGTVDLSTARASGSGAGASTLDAEIDYLDGELLSLLRPGLGLRGMLSGNVRLTGRGDAPLEFTGSLRHAVPRLGGAGSDFDVRGTLARALDEARRSLVDVEIDARSADLDALADAFPVLRSLRGQASGTMSVAGSLDDLRLAGGLDFDAGRVDFDGRLRALETGPEYAFEGSFARINAAELAGGLPESSVDGRFRFDGAGAGLGGMSGDLEIALDSGNVRGLAFRTGTIDVAVNDGRATIDTLSVETAFGRLTGAGDFGLAEDERGAVTLALVGDSIAAVREYLQPDDDGFEPQLDADGLETATGRFLLDARLEGGIDAFDATGSLRLLGITLDDLRLDSAAVRLRADSVGTPGARYHAEADAHGLEHRGRGLSRMHVDFTYADSAGDVVLEAESIEDRSYRFAAGYARDADGTDLDLRDVSLAFARARWQLIEPVRLRVARDGLTIDSLTIRRQDEGAQAEMLAYGRLPWRPAENGGGDPPVDFGIELTDIRIDDVLQLLQTRPLVGGALDGRVRVRGTAADPTIEAVLGADRLRIDEMTVTEASGEFDYADRTLTARLSADHAGRRILTGDGRIPIDLALVPVADRRLAEPVEYTLDADSIPAALLATFIPGVRDAEGSVQGQVLVRGTTREPALGGALRLDRVIATWQPSGVRYRDLSGTMHLLGDRVVAVDATGRTEAGSAALTGTVTFQTMTDPSFDLALEMRNFRAAQRPEIEFTATGGIRLTGRYTAPVVRGDIQMDGGTLYVDEIARRSRIIDLENPLLFDVIDTTLVSVQRILPVRETAFMRNLEVQGAVDIGRNFWLRGRDMNIELAGELNVELDRRGEIERRGEDLRLSGTLNAIRGSYQLRLSNLYDLYARRFTVREGTVEFLGTPGIDPDLDIIAAYRVRTAANDPLQGEPLDVLAHVTGTIRDPRVRLSSESEPPISESDLVSYLVFGRPTHDLAPGESRALGRAGGALGLADIGWQAVETALPSVFGLAASGLETLEFLGLDHVSITSTQVRAAQGPGLDPGSFGLGAELEVGRYLGPDVFMAVTMTQPFGVRQNSIRDRRPGLRLEWRFAPTWRTEFFFEDRLSRYPSFGGQAYLEALQTTGFFLTREWSY